MTSRAGPEPVERHVRSDDPEQTVELLRGAFPDFRQWIAPLPEGGPMRVRQDVAGDDRFVHQRLTLAASGRSVGWMGGAVAVTSVRSGRMTMEVGKSTVDTARPSLAPMRIADSTYVGYDVDFVAVRADVLTAAARSITGDERHRLRFTGLSPVSAAAERDWRVFQRHLIAATGDPTTLASPLVRSALFNGAVRAILLTFPNTALDADLDAPRLTTGSAVDAAAEFIQANAHRDIDADDIAAAAGSPVRDLTEGFRRRHGVTPLQYLRQQRYDGARRDLQALDPWNGPTIAEIAARWGFHHLGRFAVEYRRRFGEPPSTTRKHF